MDDLRPPADPYADIPELYDLEHDAFSDDIPFYLQSITAVGDPVLELGCGSGRLLRPIADAGFRVTGLDQSEAMLDRARRCLRGARQKRRVTLFQGGMDRAAEAPGGPFGVAIFSLNGFMHLTTPAEQRAALASVRAAMDPRGQLLIDVLNPTLEALHSFTHGVVHEGSWSRNDGTRVDKVSSRRLSTTEQVIHSRIWYDLVSSDGALRRVVTEFDLRYVHRHELELMLELAGFPQWQVYGNYELDPYDDSSERLIVAAEVTPV
ncbi:MAG: methyltransferase domain-containing protein [Thermomicrobiales bacterium]|nr:methyltransferase domain-containing protein [Thermomicrobiales bacterium]